LEICLGGSSVAGGKMKSTGTIEKGDGLWLSPNAGATNSSGFSALPGGGREWDDGGFSLINNHGIWWSSTEVSETDSWYMYIHIYFVSMGENFSRKVPGFSVRCVKDK
jgi:uncharacterized protein (TIGR02145 family)